MPSLNFKPQFADMVASGQKTQSIRKLGGIPWKVGDKAHLFTGLRTKGCRKLGVGLVTSVTQININRDEIVVWDMDLPIPETRDKFAELDGFRCWSEMRDFFEKTHGLPFTGILIKWKLEEQPK